MTIRVLLIFLVLRVAVFGQVISSIPEASLQLTPFYLSSQQRDVKLKLSSPAAIAIAASGNIYVFDDGNSRIVKLNPNGSFMAEFGQPGTGAGAVNRADLNDSIAVDKDENVYVTDPVTPRVLIFNSAGTFVRSFRSPFPMTSIAVNSQREVFLATATPRQPELIYVFSDHGKFLRKFGERLVKGHGSLARAVNHAYITCDARDNLYVAFRSWPEIRKYSPAGVLVTQGQFHVPSQLVKDSQRASFSLDFFARYPDSSFMPPLITHSITVDRRGRGYLLLNAHSIVVFSSNCQIIKQFHFNPPRVGYNTFLRLATGPNSKQVYLIDTRSGEIYRTETL
jgi:hypothetical protein